VQVEASHEILEDIFKWFLINIKNASEQHKEPTKADGEAAESKRARSETAEPHISYRQQPDESDLTFSIFQTASNEASSRLICPRASFNLEWMRNQDSRLFRCFCNNHDELDYTRKTRSPYFRN
jgi:hypothetical protein